MNGASITMMKEIATINFQDADSDEEAVAVVRASANGVSLCISLANDGDIEVMFSSSIADKLSEALREATSISVEPDVRR